MEKQTINNIDYVMYPSGTKVALTEENKGYYLKLDNIIDNVEIHNFDLCYTKPEYHEMFIKFKNTVFDSFSLDQYIIGQILKFYNIAIENYKAGDSTGSVIYRTGDYYTSISIDYKQAHQGILSLEVYNKTFADISSDTVNVNITYATLIKLKEYFEKIIKKGK